MNEIRKVIDDFKDLKQDNTHRYASFDLCFHYFQTNKDKLADNEEHITNSCLYLWSYLSSWGMLRASKLLQKSPASLKPLIEHIQNESNVWDIDIDNYTDENIDKLIKEYKAIEKILKEKILETLPTYTLVTKIMLGVYGNVPAFDAYFTATLKEAYKGKCGFTAFNTKSLKCIKAFYDKHKDEFNQQIKVLDFENKDTQLLYTKAKLVDMYGFQKGLNNEQKNKKK